MLQTDWLQRVAGINQWSQDGMRAPHKPLLLLFAIGRLANTGSSRVSFAESEQPLKTLLTDYRHPRSQPTPQYPFQHLVSDGLWTLTGVDDHPLGSLGVTALRERGVGQLSSAFEEALQDPVLRGSVIQLLLERHFPPSLHEDLLADIGLESVDLFRPPETPRGETARLPRDPRFRGLILTAYERVCGFCGFEGRLSDTTVGLEAAHIQWHTMAGPDEVANGIALCALHHKLFDKGAIGLTTDHRIKVSQEFTGGGSVAESLVLGLVDRPLIGPQAGHERPAPQYLDWHHQQVFRGPARAIAETPTR